jgi:hypothetical protein
MQYSKMGDAMKPKHLVRSAGKATGAAIGIAVAAYATRVPATWIRYGRVKRATGPDADPLLDQFMPIYEVVERHRVRVAAPAEITFAAACDMDLQDSAVIRSIFKARELILRSEPDETTRPRSLVALTKTLGWGVLAEVPGREIVMGGVTQPWLANPVFNSLPPEKFTTFRERGYIKIIWSLRSDPIGDDESLFLTETRAVSTDATARAKFRWYWSKASPGIWLIRRLTLGPLKRDAERRTRQERVMPAA